MQDCGLDGSLAAELLAVVVQFCPSAFLHQEGAVAVQLGSVLQEAVSTASRLAPGRNHLAGSSEGKAPSLGWDRPRLQFAGGDIPVYVLWVAVVALVVCTRLGVPLVSLEVSVLLLQAVFFCTEFISASAATEDASL